MLQSIEVRVLVLVPVDHLHVLYTVDDLFRRDAFITTFIIFIITDIRKFILSLGDAGGRPAFGILLRGVRARLETSWGDFSSVLTCGFLHAFADHPRVFRGDRQSL